VRRAGPSNISIKGSEEADSMEGVWCRLVCLADAGVELSPCSTRRWKTNGKLRGRAGPSKMMGAGRVEGGGRDSELVEGSASRGDRTFEVERISSEFSSNLEGMSKMSKIGASVISSGSAADSTPAATRVARLGADE
jgi:hypothetical protein